MSKPTWSWNDTLTQLGFTRQRKRAHDRQVKRRRLQLEHLEQRRVLSTTDLVASGFCAHEHDPIVQYEVVGDDAPAFTVGIYRSADGTTPDGLLTRCRVDSPADLRQGTHRVSVTADFGDVPGDYYLLASAQSRSPAPFSGPRYSRTIRRIRSRCSAVRAVMISMILFSQRHKSPEPHKVRSQVYLFVSRLSRTSKKFSMSLLSIVRLGSILSTFRPGRWARIKPFRRSFSCTCVV